MAISVRVPAPLRKYTNGAAEVSAAGETIRDVIDDLEGRFPGLRESLCDDKGEARRYLSIFAGDEDIRYLQGLGTKVEDGDEIAIVPAIAGG